MFFKTGNLITADLITQTQPCKGVPLEDNKNIYFDKDFNKEIGFLGELKFSDFSRSCNNNNNKGKPIF